MNVICTFKSGEKLPLHELEKLVNSGRMTAKKMDGTPFMFPTSATTKSSMAFDRPSPYETNGKKEKARQHKLPKSLRLPTESGDEFRKCALCNHNVAQNRHHLVPRSKSHIRPGQRDKIWTCRKCHVDVHWYFTNQELALDFWQIEKLKEELGRRRAVVK